MGGPFGQLHPEVGRNESFEDETAMNLEEISKEADLKTKRNQIDNMVRLIILSKKMKN